MQKSNVSHAGSQRFMPATRYTGWSCWLFGASQWVNAQSPPMLKINGRNWSIRFSDRWKWLWMRGFPDHLFSRWIMDLVYQATALQLQQQNKVMQTHPQNSKNGAIANLHHILFTSTFSLKSISGWNWHCVQINLSTSLFTTFMSLRFYIEWSCQMNRLLLSWLLHCYCQYGCFWAGMLD